MLLHISVPLTVKHPKSVNFKISIVKIVKYIYFSSPLLYEYTIVSFSSSILVLANIFGKFSTN